MIYRSKAPLRIGLAGGGTDVSPFTDLHGGAILNATINLYAYASIVPRHDGKIVIHAADKAKRVEYDSEEHVDVARCRDICLQLGVYNRIVKDFAKKPLAFELTTSIDVAAGSGLGTSSTLVVAIIGAFVEWLKLPLGEYDMARLAYSIEREDLAMSGGRQDQYAATFGGVNFMEFYADEKVVVNPLRIRNGILHNLEYHLPLFYTRTTRESACIIDEQKQNVGQNKQDAIQATLKLKEQSFWMKEALLKGNISEMGEILNHGWNSKKKMARNITNPYIDQLYDTAMEAGASGGKISGAGGGGFMFFYCPAETKHQVIKALASVGADYYRYNFVKEGVLTWTSKE
ncbi:hypothetical protein [Mangrovibacterium marinum]|uniref:GHMP family kinase ATP-binding protein n=1 Tax=Mangrovibacterium marinum TaxID=1639118 RepID=UPI002A186C96|nr:hypothetical protein [Mangrovibacterium marinum]